VAAKTARVLPEGECPRRKPFGGNLLVKEVATPKEREQYNRVLLEVFSREYGWTKEQVAKFDEALRNHRRFIALVSGGPVGTGMLAENKWKQKHAISRLAVLEDYRGRGIISAIIGRIEDEARKVGCGELIVFCTAALIGMYEKFGFQLVENVGRRPEDKEDNFLLEKRLS
jgi:GNAT superfamily N-acetyltransferase